MYDSLLTWLWSQIEATDDFQPQSRLQAWRKILVSLRCHLTPRPEIKWLGVRGGRKDIWLQSSPQ